MQKDKYFFYIECIKSYNYLFTTDISVLNKFRIDNIKKSDMIIVDDVLDKRGKRMIVLSELHQSLL